MTEILKGFFKGDRIIWGIYAVMLFVSILEMFSASSTLAYGMSTYYKPISLHMQFLAIGTFVAVVASNMPHKYFIPIGLFCFIMSIFLLIAVLFTPEVNGASRRIFGLQPSEVGKFGLITLVSFLLCKGQTVDGIRKNIFYYIIITTVLICGLILPENFSTAFLLSVVVFFLMFIGRVQLRRLGIIMALAVFSLGTGYVALKYLPEGSIKVWRFPTWQARLKTKEIPLVDQKLDDKNMQEQYARMALVNGGLFGKFVGKGEIRDFLPQAYSDFIFSVIIEELGIIGGLVVLFLYLFLMFRVLAVFKDCRDMFGGFLLIGLMILILFQALINMAVGVGLIPVTGQPLPLLSRGGSSTLITCGYIGIIQSVCNWVNIDKEKQRQQLLAAEAENNMILSEVDSEEESEENISEKQDTLLYQEVIPNNEDNIIV